MSEVKNKERLWLKALGKEYNTNNEFITDEQVVAVEGNVFHEGWVHGSINPGRLFQDNKRLLLSIIIRPLSVVPDQKRLFEQHPAFKVPLVAEYAWDKYFVLGVTGSGDTVIYNHGHPSNVVEVDWWKPLDEIPFKWNFGYTQENQGFSRGGFEPI